MIWSACRRFLCTLLICIAGVANAQAPPETPSAQKMVQSVGRWTFPTKDQQVEGQYLAFTPAGWNGRAPLPLLIYLHGAGYRGNDLTKLEDEEGVKQIRSGREFEAIVLFPQVTTYWSGEQAAAFIDRAIAGYADEHDPDRVYLTGESAGGGGAWEGAKLRADVLAALVPIATTIGRTEGAERLANLPVWAFHNVHDPYQVVEKSRTQVEAIRAAGGRYVFLTEYTDTPGKQNTKGQWPNAHRHAWETAYRDPALWEWIFRQRRGKPALALDPPPQPSLPAAQTTSGP